MNEEKKRSVVYGSIYYRDSWKRLKVNMENRNIPSFNLIICRPQAAFSTGSIAGDGHQLDTKQKLKHAAIFDRIFREAIEIIDKKNGIIFFQIPKIFDQESVEKWIKRVKERYNISIISAKEKKLGYQTAVCKFQS